MFFATFKTIFMARPLLASRNSMSCGETLALNQPTNLFAADATPLKNLPTFSFHVLIFFSSLLMVSCSGVLAFSSIFGLETSATACSDTIVFSSIFELESPVFFDLRLLIFLPFLLFDPSAVLRTWLLPARPPHRQRRGCTGQGLHLVR